MSISVVIYEGEPKERRFRVWSSTADKLVELLHEEKRFWEWEKDIKELKRLIKAHKYVMHETKDRLKEIEQNLS